MKITPQSDYTHTSGYIFRNRVIYDAEIVGTDYQITIDETIYSIPVASQEWVVLPENTTLDSRSMLQKAYDDLKQRDTDYHKVYLERMGIKVMTYEEEDALRHKTDRQTPDVGLPEGHSV